MTITKAVKAAIYCRVSTEMQADEEIPILGQVEECQKYCATKGWEVTKVYKDEGFTGRNIERPAFTELMADAKKKKFSKVVVWKGSRIARNVQDRLATETFMGKNGVDLVSLNEPDFEGSTRVLMLPILAAIDEYQSHIIAEDTLRGQKALARQGYSAGGMPPKGYRIKREPVGIKKSGEPLFRTRWEPDPELKDMTILAFKMLADGASSRDIIEKTGVVKEPSGISTYFRNPTFIGERVFNVHRRLKGRVVKVPLDDPDVIRIPKAHEAIISEELFNKVQRVLDKRRPGPGQVREVKNDFILSGVMWCEKHECPLVGTGNRLRKYYVCQKLKRVGSKKLQCPTIKKEAIESFILGVIKDKVFTRARIKEALSYLVTSIKDSDKQGQEEANRVKGQIAKVDEELKKLYKAITDGTIPTEHLAKPIDDCQKQKERLELQLTDLSERKAHFQPGFVLKPEMVDQIREQVVEVIDSGSYEIKRQFVQACIQQIKIAGNSVTISFSVKELPASSTLLVAGAGFEPATLPRI